MNSVEDVMELFRRLQRSLEEGNITEATLRARLAEAIEEYGRRRRRRYLLAGVKSIWG